MTDDKLDDLADRITDALLAPLQPSKDWAPLPGDVALHTMLRTYAHGDGRTCGYHSRLGKWAVLSSPPMDRECLRRHDPTDGSPRSDVH